MRDANAFFYNKTKARTLGLYWVQAALGIAPNTYDEILVKTRGLGYALFVQCLASFDRFLALTATKWYPMTVTIANRPRELASVSRVLCEII